MPLALNKEYSLPNATSAHALVAQYPRRIKFAVWPTNKQYLSPGDPWKANARLPIERTGFGYFLLSFVTNIPCPLPDVHQVRHIALLFNLPQKGARN